MIAVVGASLSVRVILASGMTGLTASACGSAAVHPVAQSTVTVVATVTPPSSDTSTVPSPSFVAGGADGPGATSSAPPVSFPKIGAPATTGPWRVVVTQAMHPATEDYSTGGSGAGHVETLTTAKLTNTSAEPTSGTGITLVVTYGADNTRATCWATGKQPTPTVMPGTSTLIDCDAQDLPRGQQQVVTVTDTGLPFAGLTFVGVTP